MIRQLQELGIHLQKIVTRLQTNQNLLKLLYYTGKDPLSGADLSTTQVQEEIYDKLIKITPRVGPKETAQSLISIRVVNGQAISDNNDFINIEVAIEIFTPLTQWFIKDSNLRPFAVMSEIFKSLDNKVVDGLGRIKMGNFELSFLTDEISCYEISFNITTYD